MRKEVITRSELLRAIDGGIYAAELARQLNCTAGGVSLAAKRHGLSLPYGGGGPKGIDQNEYRRLCEEGHSQATTARILGVSGEAVSKAAARLDLDFVSGKTNHAKDDRVRALHSQGMTISEIVAETGYTDVSRRLKRLGITPNRKPLFSKWERPIRDLAAKGLVVSEVADQLGIAQSNVSALKAKFDIPFLRDGRKS